MHILVLLYAIILPSFGFLLPKYLSVRGSCQGLKPELAFQNKWIKQNKTFPEPQIERHAVKYKGLAGRGISVWRGWKKRSLSGPVTQT